MTTREKYGCGLCIRVSEEIRLEIKKRAIEKNLTVQKWVLRAITKQIEKEKTYE